VLNSSPVVRPGSREEWRHLARFEVVDRARSLGDHCAALIARDARSRFEWDAVAHNMRAVANAQRAHDAAAVAAAAEALSRGEGIEAAAHLARAIGETLAQWYARVSGAVAEARLEAPHAAASQVSP